MLGFDFIILFCLTIFLVLRALRRAATVEKDKKKIKGKTKAKNTSKEKSNAKNKNKSKDSEKKGTKRIKVKPATKSK